MPPGCLDAGLTLAGKRAAADRLLGSLAVDDSGLYPMLTISMTTNFLASARVGDTLTATGWVTGGGRRIKFIDGEIRDAGGTVIATATGVFKPLPKERMA